MSPRRTSRLLAPLVVLLVMPVASAQAKAPAVVAYKNCTVMHAHYKGGVAKVGAKDKRKSGHAKYKPFVSTALYNANKKSDRDADGIACEQ